MEDTLGGCVIWTNFDLYDVLILVLMEDTLGAAVFKYL